MTAAIRRFTVRDGTKPVERKRDREREEKREKKHDDSFFHALKERGLDDEVLHEALEEK